MDGLRHYVISVVAAALICSIAITAAQKGTGGELVRLLSGVLLTVTLLRPITQLNLDILAQLPVTRYSEAEAISASGEKMAAEARMDIIKAQSEAYILDKASSLNAQVQVEVTISEDGLPAEAHLKGKVSPYVRQQLETILESDMGITKENQVWSG